MIGKSVAALATVLALGALGAPGALAQGHAGHMPQGQHPQGMMGGDMDIMGQHMMMMLPAGLALPPAILQARGQLALTDAQVTSLEQLGERMHAEHHPHMEAAHEAHERANAALSGDAPDLEAYGAALGEAATHMVAAHVVLAALAVEAREVLTPEQRALLPGLHHPHTMPGEAAAPGGHGHHR